MRIGNVEIFQSEYVECRHCGSIDLNCEGVCERWCGERLYSERLTGWFYWTCLPGCLPDSDPMGPFKTIQAATANAHEMEFIQAE